MRIDYTDVKYHIYAMHPFVHLNTRSCFSLLQGTAQPEELVEQCAAMGQSSLALTDVQSAFALTRFLKACTRHGVKPVLGSCLPVLLPGMDKAASLTLLAENNDGYRNIMELNTLSLNTGPPGLEELNSRSRGVLCLSGGIDGPLAGRGLHDAAASSYTESLLEVYGSKNLLLELTSHNTAAERAMNRFCLEAAALYNLDYCATNAVRYLRPQDHSLHDLILSIHSTSTLGNTERVRLQGSGYHLASGDAMLRRFKEIPEALHAACNTAARCSINIETSILRLPRLTEDADAKLRALCMPAFGTLQYGPAAAKRLEHELAVIREQGLAAYFIIVADLIRWAKDQGIPVGPGRGSAGGSLVVYCLGITRVNPLKHGLLFERFLSSERKDMPDIDIDIDWRYRERLFAYLRRSYGQEYVAHAATLDTLQPRSALRDAGRSLGFSPAELTRLSRNLSRNLPGKDGIATLPEANNPAIQQLLQAAQAISGLPRHASIHAGAAILSPVPLTCFAPLQTTDRGQTIVQLTGADCEALGLIKIDILGLRFLAVNADTAKAAGQPTVNWNDPGVYKLLQQGETAGVFQLESPGMRRLLMKLAPAAFEDLIAVLALYRPGPLRGGLVDRFIERRHGREEVIYPSPLLEDILKPTYGVLLYQEQVMQAAERIGNLSLASADTLRRAMSKRSRDTLRSLRDEFLSRAVIPRKAAEAIFTTLEHFAGYGFNKAHAAAYAITSYLNAYYKVHYPAEFFTALLNNNAGYLHRQALYLNEARRLRIPVKTIDCNTSEAGFTLENNVIRTGLLMVKHLGIRGARSILKSRRRDGSFTSLTDFCSRLPGIDSRALASLIKAGGFDFIGQSRLELLALAKNPPRQQQGQLELFSQIISPTATYRHSEERLLELERQGLEFPVSCHPLILYRPELEKTGVLCIEQCLKAPPGSRVQTAGLLLQPHHARNASGALILFALLQDETGSIPVHIYADAYRKIRPLLPHSGGIPILHGRTTEDESGIQLVVSHMSRCITDTEET